MLLRANQVFLCVPSVVLLPLGVHLVAILTKSTMYRRPNLLLKPVMNSFTETSLLCIKNNRCGRFAPKTVCLNQY